MKASTSEPDKFLWFLAMGLLVALAATGWRWNGQGARAMTFEQAVDAMSDTPRAEAAAATAFVRMREAIRAMIDAETRLRRDGKDGAAMNLRILRDRLREELQR